MNLTRNDRRFRNPIAAPAPLRRRPLATPLRTTLRAVAAAVAACFLTGAIANPTDPTVVNGTASFNQAGNVLTVTNSNGAAINWNSFSIAAGETTRFVQPSASSSVLNRVLGGDPSNIYGTLSSNGRVWLVNPAGIMVGPGGRIDVAGFVASTLHVSTEDFLAGKLGFNATPGAGNVVNQGEITTPSGGAVYLVGTQVTNEGIITTPQGETILAAGQTVSLIDTATPGVKVEITGAAGDATNLGSIVADAGRIGIAGVIVRNSGTLNASSAVSEGGKIFLRASQDAYVDGHGRIITTGTTGGKVEVLGERVAVMDNASIDASGTNGGGSILVGGDYQGKNPAIQNASVTYFGPDAMLKADAQNLGAGGTVIVWADDTTRAYGTISAHGGANGGDGGFVETSGKRYLAVDGIHVDTRAPQGTTGTWLLDPSEMFIIGGGSTTAGSTTVPSVPPGILTTEFTTSSGSSSTVSDTTINSMLDTTDVIIHTAGGTGGSGNIIVSNANISTVGSPYGGMALTLAADGSGGGGDIFIADSTIDVRDGVTLLAGWTGVMPPYGADGNTLSSADVIPGTGDITIAGSMIKSSEDAVNLWAGHDITLTNSGTQGTWIEAAAMDVQAGNNLNLIGGGGSITGLQGPGVMLYNLGIEGSQTITAGNQILLQAGNADNTSYGGSSSYGGSVTIQSNGDQTVSAATLKLVAGTAGHDNGANILGDGSQTINVTTLLDMKGGGGGIGNDAEIEGPAFGSQTIYAGGAAIILTGGASGGALEDENSANISGDGGWQTVYAGSVTINGGSATYGGAGFGGDDGSSQTFYITGDLTMNGGSSASSDFFATPVYIGSEHGGGTINVNVGGNIVLNGGSSLGGGVLIGSINDFYCPDGCFPAATSVTLNAGNNITATGNTGGVWLGVLNLTAGSSGSTVVLKAGWDSVGEVSGPSGYGGNITTSGPVGIQVDGVSGDIGITAYESSAGAYGGVSLGAGTAAYGSGIDVAADGDNAIAGSLMATSGINLYAGGGQRAGNLILQGTSNLGADDFSLNAEAGTATPYGGGSITQAGSLESYGGGIDMYADRDITINGSVKSASFIYLLAGDNATDAFGGNLLLGASSNLEAMSYVDMYATAGTTTSFGGSITQAGSLTSYGSGIYMLADRDTTINGSVKSASYIQLEAGNNNTNEFGGNLLLGATSNLEAMDGVYLYATAGTTTSFGGSITQAGSLTSYGSSIYMLADRDININGSVTSGGDLYLWAGYYQTNAFGGNLTFGAGSVVMADGAEGFAYSGAESRGDIVQSGGSIYSDYTIEFYADGSVRLNGMVQSLYATSLYAGLDIYEGYTSPYYNSVYGGDIVLGSGSLIEASHVDMYANRGSDEIVGGLTGNVTQAGGLLHATTYDSLNIYAAGNVDLLGSVMIDNAAPANIYAGISYPDESDFYFQDKHITINSLNALGSKVELYATGPIFANTQNADGIYAVVDNSNSGGIVINNTGAAQPSFWVGLYNYAAANRAITFTHAGSDLTLDGSYYFETYDDGASVINGSILVAAPSNNLTYDGAGLYGSSVILAAGGMLDVTSGLSLSGNANLSLVAPTVNVMDYVGVFGTLNVIAGTLNNMGSSGTLYGTDLNMIAGNINGEGGAHFQASNNINATVANNITLTDGAHFHAGDDINLALDGAGSTVSLSNGSFMHANAPTTIHIDFAARNSGGIFINGLETITNASDGTGFFVGPFETPAVPGAGLEITYANPANQAILAILDSNSGEAGETEEERQRRLQQTEDNGEQDDPADKPVAQCS